MFSHHSHPSFFTVFELDKAIIAKSSAAALLTGALLFVRGTYFNILNGVKGLKLFCTGSAEEKFFFHNNYSLLLKNRGLLHQMVPALHRL